MYCQSFEIITKLLKVLVSECLAKTETRSVLDFLNQTFTTISILQLLFFLLRHKRLT